LNTEIKPNSLTLEQATNIYRVIAMLASEMTGTTITVTSVRKREEGEPWHAEIERC
jgi:hypothetical protein